MRQCAQCPEPARARGLCWTHYGRMRVAGKSPEQRPDGISRRKLRREVLAAYGGVCACCGETRIEFLAIDHINGVKPPGLPRVGLPLYTRLRALGYPPGFRVLCHNCNVSLGLYGYCPHGLTATKAAS